MKDCMKKAALLLGVAMMAPILTKAQDKIETSLGADIVSSYMWRGQDCGGTSIQPSLGFSYKGLSLNAWGSASFTGDSGNGKELDLTLSYTTGGLTVGITDYWFGGNDYGHYKAHSTTHVWEANVGYDFGVVALNWYTNFAGNDGLNKDGDRAYSSYFAASAPFTLGGVDFTGEIGITPWRTTFYNGGANGFEVCDVSVAASKDIKVTDSFSIPVIAKVGINPATENAYFTFGLSF